MDPKAGALPVRLIALGQTDPHDVLPWRPMRSGRGFSAILQTLSCTDAHRTPLWPVLVWPSCGQPTGRPQRFLNSLASANARLYMW